MGMNRTKLNPNRNGRFLLSVYEREEDILGVSRAVRDEGLTIVDVHTPYAVHGLDEAMGLRASRLPWVCFALAIIGATAKVWFEYWTSWLDWPINVGGKPWDSLPAFMPVTFEVMVLCAGVSTVIAFFISRRLFPGRRASIPFEGITDDRFVLIIEETDASFDPDAVRRLLQPFNPVHIEERVGPKEAQR